MRVALVDDGGMRAHQTLPRRRCSIGFVKMRSPPSGKFVIG